MNLIKKIINWIKNLLNKWFGKKKITKKIKGNINNARNKKYLKGYGAFIEDSYNETFPLYLMINKEEKKKILEKIEILKRNIDLLPEEEKKEELAKIKKVIKKIEKSEISIYQNNKIMEKLDNYFAEERKVKHLEKRDKLYEDIFQIVDNFDENIKEKTVKEYKYVNYITLTTLLIDETKEELMILEENFKKHKYNKSYYDRELKKIKERIKNLKKIRDGVNIQHEIYKLRKDLYTKSKDKYDLLYNEEAFLGIEKECDDMLKKVDKRVIDLKKMQLEKRKEVKEEKEDKEDKKKQEEKEFLENILKRFQDMELARKLLLLNEEKTIELGNINDLVSYMNEMYIDFLNGEKVIFNFEKNKSRTELVKLYNNINKITCKLKEEEYISIDHINYQLDDLLLVTDNKKRELEDFLELKYNYKKEKHEESILVNNKLEILKEKEDNKERILVKVNENKDN